MAFCSADARFPNQISLRGSPSPPLHVQTVSIVYDGYALRWMAIHRRAGGRDRYPLGVNRDRAWSARPRVCPEQMMGSKSRMQGKVSSEQNAMPTVYVGIDVCKEWLDIHLHPLGRSLRVANDTAGLRRLCRCATSPPQGGRVEARSNILLQLRDLLCGEMASRASTLPPLWGRCRESDRGGDWPKASTGVTGEAGTVVKACHKYNEAIEAAERHRAPSVLMRR